MQGVSRMNGAGHRASLLDRFVVGALALAISGCGGYWGAAAYAATVSQQAAEIRGSVLAADGLTAIRGVSVKAANMETRQIYTSSVTGDNGGYRLSGLPAGSYDLAVETPQGLFAADKLIDAGAGTRTIVSLALRPTAQSTPPDPAKPSDPTPATPDEPKPADPNAKAAADPNAKPPEPAQPEPKEQKKKKKGGSFWRTPGGAAIAIVVGAALVGAAASGATGNNNDDENSMTAGGTSIPH